MKFLYKVDHYCRQPQEISLVLKFVSRVFRKSAFQYEMVRVHRYRSQKFQQANKNISLRVSILINFIEIFHSERPFS